MCVFTFRERPDAGSDGERRGVGRVAHAVGDDARRLPARAGGKNLTDGDLRHDFEAAKHVASCALRQGARFASYRSRVIISRVFDALLAA